MSNANRDYAIVYDVKNSLLVLSRPLNFYLTDKNTSNIFVKLVTRVIVGDGIDQYTDIENASSYVLTMRVIKPDDEVKSIIATQHESESIFQFDLTEDFKDVPGKYICELTISNIVSGRQELITSDPFNYEVKRSILSEVGEIIETEDTTVEKLLNDLDATKAELSSQFKETANNIYYITPKNFNDDIQNAIEYAFANNIPCVKLEGKKYVLTDSILVYSNMTLEGVKGKTILELKGVNRPIIAKKGGILGNTHIKNIKVIGEQTQPNNHGIVLNDYYSSVTDCEAKECGGYGFYISEDGAGGTLIENRIENCVAKLCKNTSFYLGSPSNKITDGFLLNCISHGSMNNSALYIGSSAGWNVNGLHTYCHAEAVAVEMLNSYHTFVNNIYIEDFNETALNFGSCQQGLNISNITTNFKAGATNSTVIYLNHSTSHGFITNVNISNITVNSGGNLTNCSVFGGDDSAYTAYVSNTAITGNKEGLSLIKKGLSLPRYKIISDARVTGKLYVTKDITEDERGILYNGYKIPVYKSGIIYAGNTEQTIVIELPYIKDYEKIIADFKMYTSVWDVGTERIKYSTELLISAKTKTSCRIYENNLIQSVGFSSEPSFVFDKVNKTLTVKFTPSDADGTGIWVCNMYQL